MRKTLGKRISRFFGAPNSPELRYELNDYEHNGHYRYSSVQTNFTGRTSPAPLSRRRVGYNEPILPFHQTFLSENEQVLRLSKESRQFVETITIAGLSQLLIWYTYHDLVPARKGNGHWYLELPRDQIIGWIRFGYELGREMSKHSIRQLPTRFQEVVDHLGIDGREVCRKLIRLSDADEMRRHEMVDLRLTNSSNYLVIGEKLEGYRSMIAALRPLPMTMWAEWQGQILEHIEAYMETVIRPAIDPTKQPLHSSKLPERDAERKEILRLFNKICAYHTDYPLGSIYEQALSKLKWSDANEALMSREHVMARHESSWFPSNFRSSQGWNAPYRPSPEVEQRRRSAPVLDDDKSILLSIQENMDSLREDVDIIRVHCFMNKSDTRGRAIQRLIRQEKGLVSRARKHMGAAHLEVDAIGESDYHRGTSEGNTDNDCGVKRRNHAGRLPKALQSILLNTKASKSTPDLMTNGLLSNQSPEQDSSCVDEQETPEQTAVQQHIFNLSSRANERGTSALGSPLTLKRSSSYANSIQRSEAEEFYHRRTQPLDTRHKRNGFILEEEFNTLQMHPTGLAGLHRKFVAQDTRNDSILLEGQRGQINDTGGSSPTSEEPTPNPFENFTGAHFRPATAKNVSFSRNHVEAPLMTSIGYVNTKFDTLDLPGKSKSRLSDATSSELDSPTRTHSLTMISSMARGCGSPGSPSSTYQDTELRRTTPTVGLSGGTVEKQARVLSPTDSSSAGRKSPDGLEEYRCVYSSLLTDCQEKEKIGKFVEDLG